MSFQVAMGQRATLAGLIGRGVYSSDRSKGSKIEREG